jgi:hypothetical protein
MLYYYRKVGNVMAFIVGCLVGLLVGVLGNIVVKGIKDTSW